MMRFTSYIWTFITKIMLSFPSLITDKNLPACAKGSFQLSSSCSILLVTGFLRKELASFLVALQIRVSCICWESTGQLLCCSWKWKPLSEYRLNPHDNHMVVGNDLEVSVEQGRDVTGRAVSCDCPIHRGATDSQTIKKTALRISGGTGPKRQNFVVQFLSPPRLGPLHSKGAFLLCSRVPEWGCGC